VSCVGNAFEMSHSHGRSALALARQLQYALFRMASLSRRCWLTIGAIFSLLPTKYSPLARAGLLFRVQLPPARAAHHFPAVPTLPPLLAHHAHHSLSDGHRRSNCPFALFCRPFRRFDLLYIRKPRLRTALPPSIMYLD